jgi:hypothetical protein
MKLYIFTLLFSFSVVVVLALPGNNPSPPQGIKSVSTEKTGTISPAGSVPGYLSGMFAAPEPKPYTFYPNPARGNTLHVDYESNNGNTLSIRILNMLGVALVDKKFDVSKGINTLSLDISRLLKGLYLLEIVDSPNRYVEKLVVENE